MNRKTFFITTATSLASAVVLLSAPAHAQLLGGAGNLAGNMSGQIGRNSTGLGGALGADGRLSGRLPHAETGRATGAAERAGERASVAAQSARERAANSSVQGSASGNTRSSITTPVRSIDGAAAGGGSAEVNKGGASAEADGSARASIRR